jgi:hypothetical protein
MGLTGFWEAIDAQLAQVREAKTVDEVLAACPPEPDVSVGAGWFGGSGGDEQLIDYLGAGWKITRYSASYYWVAQDANGDFLSYTEGDLDKGDNPMCGA